MDSRFGLSVGALFAVVGNKYIIDSSLPESSTFTLVDALHGLTLLYILLVVIASAYSLRLIKEGKLTQSLNVDRRVSILVLVSYIALNAWLIWNAMDGG